LQISCIGGQHKSVRNYEHRLTLGKVIAIIQRVTFLLVHFVPPPALTPLQKRPFQLAKMLKNTRSQRWLLKKNYVGYAMFPGPMLGGATAPLLRRTTSTPAPTFPGAEPPPPLTFFWLRAWLCGYDVTAHWWVTVGRTMQQNALLEMYRPRLTT